MRRDGATKRLLQALMTVGVVLSVYALPLCAQEVRFANDGRASLRFAGREYLGKSEPRITNVLLEQNSAGSDGYRQGQWERVAGSATNTRFDLVKKALKHQYSWGAAEFQYQPGSHRLDVCVTLHNSSTRTIADFSVTVLDVSFPTTPATWNKGLPTLARSLDNLAVVQADVPKGRLFACNLTTDPPFVLGFDRHVDKAGLVFPFVIRGGIATPEAGTYWAEPHGVPRIAPGKSLTVKVTIRFGGASAAPAMVLADAYEHFRSCYRFANVWKDRRPIAMITHASNFKNHVSPTNPRGWLSNPKLDVTTQTGKAEFRREMLKAAARSVEVIKQTGGQGMIFWDIEGQENPHPISYIGDPRLAKKLAPEMDEIADEYFKVYRDAGLRTGVCLRPSQVYYDEAKQAWAHGTGSDGGPGRGSFFPELRPKDIPWWRFYPLAERLSERIAYCKKRWGCTLFYVDSNGVYRQSGEDQKFRWFLLDAAVWQKVKADHPDVLIIPEHARDDQAFHVANWAYTATYYEVRMGGYRTPDKVRELLPDAFSVININDGDIHQHRAEIKAGVARGDILLFRGWFADNRNAWVKSLYDDVTNQRN